LHGSLVARVGGDEFVVLIPGHDLDQVMAAARDLCLEAAQLPLGYGVSCGVAVTNPETGLTTAQALFSAADQAQYRAKRERRTGPCLAGP
jgi:diguanylate cyclase (GGDEF)-like protein